LKTLLCLGELQLSSLAASQLCFEMRYFLTLALQIAAPPLCQLTTALQRTAGIFQGAFGVLQLQQLTTPFL
jgi:hypothetical protein